MSVYDYSAVSMMGKEVSLEEYRGKVLLIVNTASECGFTYQYQDLQRLYDRYKDQGLVILGFPCNQFADQEPGSNEQVQAFCTLRYGVSFPMFNKVNVRDADVHPLFQYLTSAKPFDGFDETHPPAKLLNALIEEKFPHFMDGDSIKWNFTKFLIGRGGQVVKRFESTVEPMDMETDIEAELALG
ncbi:glutathione peroxidase [Paenibacillus sp. D51F]